ncbi:MAG: 5-oxoprolinase subunit PxpB [Bacteroidota bacterium]
MRPIALGDNGIIFQFPTGINETTHLQVMQLFYALAQVNYSWVIDIIPAYDSVTVFFDLRAVSKIATSNQPHQWVQETLSLTSLTLAHMPASIAPIAIPACYDSSLAPDLQNLATLKNLSVEEVINLHSSLVYKVYMIGFLPGFAYMGTVHERIQMKRKDIPATHVAAGSIGIAGEQTGIYPLDSPGGWQIIARTPISIFDIEKESPCYLAPGNLVQFMPISLTEFNKIKSRYT